jgi:hypothetical protein
MHANIGLMPSKYMYIYVTVRSISIVLKFISSKFSYDVQIFEKYKETTDYIIK